MKKEFEVTLDISNDYLVQFSEKYTLDKYVNLTVPRGYVAIVYVDGKAMYKEKQVTKANILKKLGNEYRGCEVQFAFYAPKIQPEVLYGFGPINVNNSRLKEAYRVGVNGTMTIEVIDYIELINYFAFTDSISVEDVRERILPVIKSVGVPIVSSCFVNTDVSVFEINSMISNIREEMIKGFINERALEKLGIEVNSVTINEIFVNEDDLELIRNRINN